MMTIITTFFIADPSGFKEALREDVTANSGVERTHARVLFPGDISFYRIFYKNSQPKAAVSLTFDITEVCAA